LKIIIIGCGKVGFTLAEHLSKEDHDVTIIDVNDATLQKASNTLDVMCIKGNGAALLVLDEAGAASADVVIAATDSDELNMVCCLSAKRMGASYVIARIRNAEYTVGRSALKKDLGIDLIINPEQATAVEISRLLRFPSASNIETFYRGRVELVGFRLQEDDFLSGKTLGSLSHRLRGHPILFCAVARGEEVFIPNGNSQLLTGDLVYMIGEPLGVSQFFKELGRYTHKVREVFITGGGRITYYLATMLEKLGYHTKVVECREERCRHLTEVLPHTLVICGDGTDQDLLESENLSSSDAFVALTDRDEYNLIVSLYAMQQGVPKVVAKSNRQNYIGIAHSVGLDSVISPKLITANHILQVVRGMQNSKGSVMKSLYKIAGERAEAMEFVVNSTTRHLGIPLKDLRLKKGILIAVLIHNNKIIIPEGSSCIREGDTVIIVSRGSGILDINDIYAAGGGEA
jgi:trk system potassium uptake protein TrkA